MQIAGTPQVFANGFLPADYVSDILDLVLLAWGKVQLPKPPQKTLEPRISALLRDQIIEELDHINLPVTAHIEGQKTDPITGKQLFRTDIEFHPQNMNIKIAKQKPYLTLEAKCLQIPNSDGSISAQNSEYIEDMFGFINDKKKIDPSFCTMIGYVMSGGTTHAHKSLQSSLAKKAKELDMPSTGIQKHGNLSHPPHGVTKHKCPLRKSGELPIYHLLLPNPNEPES